MTGELHIITLNIPYPPDYGGMIDSFHRIRVLHEAGIRIHLHCFEYGRKPSDELKTHCCSINYYKRDTSLTSFFPIKPYIVSSRNSYSLPGNLLNDDHPVLFDGLHTTYFLSHPYLSCRKKYIRVHNIEHEYYNSLSRHESNPLKSLFYKVESLKLKNYEKIIKKADLVLTISENDQRYFENKYSNAEIIMPFHEHDDVETREGSGDYIIWHGDLSVNENVIVAEYLINSILSRIQYKSVIAGKNPPGSLMRKAGKYSNIELIANPDNQKMADLIRNAQINLLFALTTHGMKIKLLNALFAGRHCLVNGNMISGTRLGAACHIEDSADGIIRRITDLMQQPFTGKMIAERRSILEPYTNRFNASRLIKLIFPE